MSAAEVEEDARDDRGMASGAQGVTVGGYARPKVQEEGAFAGRGQRVRGKLDRRRGTHRPTAGRWRAHLHGFSCNQCGATTATDRSDQSRHDLHHEDDAAFRAAVERDMLHLHEAIREVAARNAELEHQLEAERAHNDACLVLMAAIAPGAVPEADDVLGAVIARLLAVKGGPTIEGEAL